MRSLALAVSLTAALLACSPAAASAAWQWPVEGRVLTPYRNGDDPYAGGQHRGIDIAAAVGTPVVAAAAGTVTFAGLAGASGQVVAVRTDDGYDTSYLHLAATRVRAGDQVTAGTELGAVGTTGRRSTAEPHLHFGVRDAGSRFAYHDPMDFLPPPFAPSPRAVPVPLPIAAPAATAVRTRPASVAGSRVPSPALAHGAVGASLPAVVAGVLGAPAQAAGSVHGASVHHLPAAGAAASLGAGRPATAPGSGVPPVTHQRSPLRGPSRAPAGGSQAHPASPRHPHGARRRVAAARPVRSPAAGPRSNRKAPPARTPAPDPRHVLAARRGRGLDVGWLVACAALVAAAALLGRPRAMLRSLRELLRPAPAAPRARARDA